MVLYDPGMKEQDSMGFKKPDLQKSFGILLADVASVVAGRKNRKLD